MPFPILLAEIAPVLAILLAAATVALVIRTILALRQQTGAAQRQVLRQLSVIWIVVVTLIMIGNAILALDRGGARVPKFVEQFTDNNLWEGWGWAFFDLLVYGFGVYAVYRLWSYYLRTSED